MAPYVLNYEHCKEAYYTMSLFCMHGVYGKLIFLLGLLTNPIHKTLGWFLTLGLENVRFFSQR